MITLDYRVGGWVKKCQNIDYVILERSLMEGQTDVKVEIVDLWHNIVHLSMYQCFGIF